MTNQIHAAPSIASASEAALSSGSSGGGGSKDNLVYQVKLSPNGQLLAISTPETVAIYSTTETESNPKASIRTLILPDPPREDPTLDPSSSEPLMAFPRCLAFSPDSKRLAITGDDKSIRIWNVSEVQDGKLIGFQYGKQILHQNLPKRASMIGWEGNETIIVADKFGDVRSFTIGSAPKHAPIKQKSSEQPPTKKAKTEQSNVEEEEEGEDEEQDSSLKPHLGHVSFLTSFLLAGKSPKDSSSRYILTADRDGHIRVSRWGSRKAAWVTENFLLGSQGCVGSILLLPSSSDKDENLLLSSDGGSSLHLWNYLAPAGKKQRISTSLVKGALIDRVAICPEREKCKESRKLDENGRFKGSSRRSGKASKDKAEANGTSNAQPVKAEPSIDPERAGILARIKSAKQDLGLVITSLESFKSKSGETFILFTAEGSTSFFHLPLSSILEISAASDPYSPSVPEKDLSSLVVATDAGAPILSLDLTQSSQDGSIQVWTASDTRRGARLSREGIQNELWRKEDGDGGELEIESPGLDCFHFDGAKFSKLDLPSQTPEGAILNSVHELTKESRKATYGASRLDLYPALLWPKLSPEVHNLQWTIQNEEASKNGKGSKPKYNKQQMRDAHKEVIEKARKWLEERKL